MSTKTFGYNKTYDWSSTYWSTLTNVDSACKNTSTATTSDGYITLAFSTATTDYPWDDLTGWTAGGDGNYVCEISPAGQLRMKSPDNDNGIANLWQTLTPTGNVSIMSQWAIDVPSTSTATDKDSGSTFWFWNTYRYLPWIRGNGTNLTCYNQTADTPTLSAVTLSPSVTQDTRFHTEVVKCNTTAHTYYLEYDGLVLATGIAGYSSAGLNRLYFHCGWQTGEGTAHEHHVVKSGFWNNTLVTYATADGILESDATSAIFDAGAGKRWSTLSWTHDTSNSTTIAYQVRCASSSGGLAGASYETIAASGNSIVTKDRFVQVKITMADASSGQYTPVLKDLTLADEDAPSKYMSTSKFW